MISPTDAIASVPAGAWAVGVSGGADSVALLCLLRDRADLSLHVVHLDHQLRGQASAEDAEFVHRLAEEFNLTDTIVLREQLEPSMENLPHNPSAKYRAMRLELFRRVVAGGRLQGVMLAHHADDQAETILSRLIRGASAGGLRGMPQVSRVGRLVICRPLLGVTRRQLREYLNVIGQLWREDASNESDMYQRNRLRRWLAGRTDLRNALLNLGQASGVLVEWIEKNSPKLPKEFRVAQLQRLPRLLARESARRWLIAEGARPDELSGQVLDRLIEMASDAASASRQLFPGPIEVVRRGGRIHAERR